MSKTRTLDALDNHLSQIKLNLLEKSDNSNLSPEQLTTLRESFDRFSTLTIMFPSLIPSHVDKIKAILSYYDEKSGFWKYNKFINYNSHFIFQYELMIKPSVLGVSVLHATSLEHPTLSKNLLEDTETLLKTTTNNITNWIERFYSQYANHQFIDWWNIFLWMTRRFHLSGTLKTEFSRPYKELVISLLKKYLENLTESGEKPLGNIITLEELHWRLTGKFSNHFPEIIDKDPLLNILSHKKLYSQALKSPQLMFEDLLWLPYHSLTIPKQEVDNIKTAIKIIAKRMNKLDSETELNINMLICRIQQARITET